MGNYIYKNSKIMGLNLKLKPDNFTILLVKLVCEFLGTFFLVLTIASSIGQDLQPLAIGIVLMINIYTFGYISGAHFNPSVSAGIFVIGNMSLFDFVAYVIFQCGGGFCGAMIGRFLAEQNAMLGCNIYISKAFVAEFLFTFLLVTVVLNTAVNPKNSTNGFYGFAIGGVVLVGAVAVGPYSGGAFNPAVAVGLSLTR